MKIHFLTLITALSYTGLLNAQYTEYEVREMVANASEDELVVESSRMLQDNYYYFSEIVVDKLLELNPSSANYNYRKGFMILGSRHDFVAAKPFLEKAVADVDPNYDMYSSKEQSAPTDAYYHMAKCYHFNEELDKAVEYYNKFIASSRKKSELLPKAELGILQCEVAREAMRFPRSAVVKNVGPEINSEYPEYSPVVSLDGKSLYFTSRRPWKNGETESFKDPQYNQYPEDIYSSYSALDTWTTPNKLDFCNDQNNEATIAVSSDERRVYAYQDVTGGGDIYFSEFSDNKFQTLDVLQIQGINTAYWETHCTVSPDGNSIFFVSDRPGGYGGRDIYRILKLTDGTWSAPFNLGPNINSAYDEESPFIAADNKTMYFASNGPMSMGGFDIFVAIRDAENNWSTPINLGYPINRMDDDLFYTTTIDGLRGYLSSFRVGGYGEKDIYEIQNDYMGVSNVVVLNGALKMIDGSPLPITATIKLKCISCGDDAIEIKPRMRDGAFLTSLQPCKEYELIFMKSATEELKRETFSTSCNTEYEEIYRDAFIGNYLFDITVLDKSTGLPISNAKVEIFDPITNSVLETLTSDKTGVVNSSLLGNKKIDESMSYSIKVTSDKYLAQTNNVTVTLTNEPKISLQYKLDKIDVGTDIAKVIDIQPIYFDLNKFDIRPDAQIELDKIVKIMNENPLIEIELGSHTDCRGSKSYNEKLSDKRAKSSAEYIKSRISNPERINGKGYGEYKLINLCECEGNVITECSEEEHQANRRTEFRIIKL